MIKTWMFSALFLLANTAWSAHHFTDMYETENGWRVDHFSAEPGRLQKLVSSHSFRYRVEAEKYADEVSLDFPKEKSFSLVSREENVAPLWVVTKAWNADWEQKYSEWVSREFTTDFFSKTNLATDCADVAYALRWIFARNNQLPAAATLGGSGKIATHLTASADWNKLPGHALWYKDQRFMAGLRWLLNMVFTKTLYADTYPVKISRDSIRPGLINLLGAHTEVFKQVSYDKGEIPLIVLSSTVPQAVRVLTERVYMDSEPIPRADGGLLHFRWPVKSDDGWKLTLKERMPDYSVEQYQKNLCSKQGHFTFCMMEILHIDYDGKLIAEKLIKDLMNFMTTRIQVVKDGMDFCAKNDCSLPTMGYEDWSTPSRDKRLAKSFSGTYQVLDTLNETEVFNEWIKDATISVPFEMKVTDFRDRLLAGLVSYDPRVSLEERWAKDASAIESHLIHRSAEINDVRNALVNKAYPCRMSPETCMRDGKSFRTLSTVEPDQELRKLYAGWMDYAEKSNITVSAASEDMLFSLFRKSPAPWDPYSERHGEVRGQGHFLHARKVSAGAKGFLILDQRRLYSLSSRSLVDLGKITGLYFDVASGKYLAHDQVSLQVLDSSLNPLASFRLEGYRKDLVFVHSFGNGTVFISECLSDSTQCFGTKSGWTLDLMTLTAGESFRFFNVHRETDRPEAILFADREFISMALVNNKIETMVIARMNDLSHAVYLQNHDYLVTEDKSVGIINKDGFKVLLTSDDPMYIERMNSNFIAFGNWNGGVDGYFDIQRNALTNVRFEMGPDRSGDRKMGVAFSRIATNALLFAGNTVTAIPLKFKFDYSPVVTSAENWFSLETGNVQDYKGGVLESSDFIMKGLCQGSKYNSLCLSPNENVLVEYFMSPYSGGEFYYTYARLGKNLNRKISEVYAYGIVENLSETSLSSADTNSFMPSIGTSIPVGQNRILWFP